MTKPIKTMSFVSEIHASNLAKFINCLEETSFWHILPAGETDVAKACGLFDTRQGNLYPPAATTVAALGQFLAQHPFVYVEAVDGNKVLATLHSATRLLWNHETSDKQYTVADSQPILPAIR